MGPVASRIPAGRTPGLTHDAPASPLAQHFGQRLQRRRLFGMQRTIMMAGTNHSVTLCSQGCHFTSISMKQIRFFKIFLPNSALVLLNASFDVDIGYVYHTSGCVSSRKSF